MKKQPAKEELSLFANLNKLQKVSGEPSKFPLTLGFVAIALFFVTVAFFPGGGKFGILSLLKNLQAIFAAGGQAFEAETGTIAAPAAAGADSNASAGQYIQFGSGQVSTNFQPTAPYYSTFFYLWYKNQATDGAYSYWQDHGNVPPNTFFSHYLPDVDPGVYDSAKELYSNNDYNTFKWQAAKLSEAKIEVAIGSWFGQNTKQNSAFDKIVNDFMARADNPYPNLRWSIYHEAEGFGEPTVTSLVSDLTHIRDKFTNSPYYLKVNGKPVIFVYGGVAAEETQATSKRWKDANAALGNAFYLVLKVYPGFQTDPNQPDSWHQYAPGDRGHGHAPYSYFVSPGFWLDNGSAVTLCRNLDGPANTNCKSSVPTATIPSFKSAVGNMLAANATWKTIQTWNEWGEGTSVEPGVQTMKDAAGKEVIDPGGVPFGNAYVNVLKELLPPLESPSAQPCAGAAGTFGSVTMNVNIASAGTYNVWSRLNAPDSEKNSYYLEVDGSCLVVGDAQLPSNAWTWVGYRDGNTSNKIALSLSAGAHTFKLIGREAGVKVDRLILTGDASCVPTDKGDNCLAVSPSPSPSPTPSPATSPSPTPLATPPVGASPSPSPSPTPPANSETLRFLPTDDATVRQSSPTSNYGLEQTLLVDSSTDKHILLKYDLRGIGTRRITSAKLRIYCVDSSNNGGQVRGVANNSWSEQTVTWSNAPAADSTASVSVGGVKSGRWYEVDVLQLVSGDGLVSFKFTSTSENGADYSSKESANDPELIVSVQ